MSLFSKEKVKYLIGFLFIILIAVAFSGIRSCSDERKINKDQREMFHKNVNALKDKHQEEVIAAYSKSDQEVILKDSRIKGLMDSLGIARKNIVYYKYIALQKSSTAIITKYDTLYEFIELEGGRLSSFTQKLDNCLTVKGEFTPKGLVLTADKVTEIHDINYFKRRNLFGLKWTPRIGKKEYYQTLTTSCNDTITENRRIIFKRN